MGIFVPGTPNQGRPRQPAARQRTPTFRHRFCVLGAGVDVDPESGVAVVDVGGWWGGWELGAGVAPAATVDLRDRFCVLNSAGDDDAVVVIAAGDWTFARERRVLAEGPVRGCSTMVVFIPSSTNVANTPQFRKSKCRCPLVLGFGSGTQNNQVNPQCLTSTPCGSFAPSWPQPFRLGSAPTGPKQFNVETVSHAGTSAVAVPQQSLSVTAQSNI